jgi:hypothetical protein
VKECEIDVQYKFLMLKNHAISHQVPNVEPPGEVAEYWPGSKTK